ncbi:MAG: helix-turn-helix transcriptional regulator [Candidatus Lambdaproteobacteria bacterium]|nr:helix-turn-helix transcriptional regulator [Candidatus Lambdaproteobacteria bacterium]
MEDKDLYAGLIRLHILHHAQQAPVFGQGIMEELQRHGYRLSPGTIYPMLHAMERAGYLKSHRQHAGRRVRRPYAITAKGAAALSLARQKVWELFGELFEEGPRSGRPPGGSR